MPHCILEYSQNLEQEIAPIDMLEAVKEACIAANVFTSEDIKLRSFPYKNFMTCGQEDAFIHVMIRLLSGRTSEEKKTLSQLVLDALTKFPLKDVSFSVELCDMDRETYVKKVVLSQ